MGIEVIYLRMTTKINKMKINKKVELLMELREDKAKQIRSLTKEVEDLTGKIWIEMKLIDEKGGNKNVEGNNITSNQQSNDNNNNGSTEQEKPKEQ